MTKAMRKFCEKFLDPYFTSGATVRNAARPIRVFQMLADLGDAIYWFGCVVATVILALGVIDY
jgi:hypothetical protein